MSSATLIAMSRHILHRHRHLAVLLRRNDPKFSRTATTNFFMVPKRLGSSSSSTPTVSKTTLGTGEFGNITPPPTNVTLPPLLPEDEPGPDENPYSYSTVYRKGRFDWLFGDGWRRPPTKEQGQRVRRNWFNFGYHPTDEYEDWKKQHVVMFFLYTLGICGSVFFLYFRADWPQMNEWAIREAYLEMARREKYGLPYISKDYIDPEKVAAQLPSDEELGDFEIII